MGSVDRLYKLVALVSISSGYDHVMLHNPRADPEAGVSLAKLVVSDLHSVVLAANDNDTRVLAPGKPSSELVNHPHASIWPVLMRQVTKSQDY